MKKLFILLALVASCSFAVTANLWVGAGTETKTVYTGITGDMLCKIADVITKIASGNGTAAAPSYTFGADQNTGLYRVAADELGFTVNGVYAGKFTAAGLNVVGTISPTVGQTYPDGAVGTPAWSFTADPDTGLYRIGANNLGFATNGVLAFDMTAALATLALPLNVPVGAAATPSIYFTGDANSGLYHIGADDVGITTNGILAFDVSATAVSAALPVAHPAGAVGTPSVTFTGDLDSGMYAVGANDVAIAANGVMQADFTITGIQGAIGQTTPAAGAFTTPTSTTASNVTYKYSTASWETIVASETHAFLALVACDNIQIDEIYAWSYVAPVSAAGTILLNVLRTTGADSLIETPNYDLEAIGANTGTNLPVQTTDPTHLAVAAGDGVYITIASNNAIGTNCNGGVTIKYHNR